MLYPYRPSALKNRQRWSFGILYPPDYEEVPRGTERSSMHSECLLQPKRGCRISVNLRFLHLVRRPTAAPNAEFESTTESFEQVTPRSLEFHPDIDMGQPQRFEFDFPESCSDGGPDISTRCGLRGSLTFTTESIARDVLKLSIGVRNETHSSSILDRDSAMPRSLLSAHLILAAECGEFASLLDPPEEYRGDVRACRNIGNFPVLVGTDGERDVMLCSPIILYDYPQIAPESAGDFYDSTEMDEMLTLRVMTLSEPEKAEMRCTGDHMRALLERTEQTAREQLMKTHGTIRSLRPVIEPADSQDMRRK